MRALTVLNKTITDCMACPRLVIYRQEIARQKRKQYRDWTYWGGQFPASEIAKLGSMCLDWLLRHMEEIEQAVSSPVIGVGTGCMMPCIGMDSPTKPCRHTKRMACH